MNIAVKSMISQLYGLGWEQAGLAFGANWIVVEAGRINSIRGLTQGADSV